MAHDMLAELRRLVVDDPAVRCRLLSVPDRGAFVAEVLDVARSYEIELSVDEVTEALRDARRWRYRQWV